jgi:predicted metal-dependent HD superfamily phosphohydrolase
MLKALEQEVKEYVTQLFEQADTAKLFYHNYQHTLEVVQRIEALATDLNSSDLLLLKIAGWFHDVGYLYAYDKHEERGMVLAENYLKNKGIDVATTKLVTACIEATQISLEPRNSLEKIIKDADIGYGTTEQFRQTGTLLRKEWAFFLEHFYTDENWEILQYNFLIQVQFYTDSAKKEYGSILQQNILHQKKRLQ